MLHIKPRYLSPLILTIGNLFYTGSFSLVKFFSLTVGVETIMLFRFLAGPLYLIPYFLIKKKNIKIHNFPVFLCRIFFGVTGMTCLFLSFKYGDIGKSMLIFECATIWTLLYGYFMHKEIPHKYSLFAIPFAFLGLILILKPYPILTLQLGDAFAFLGSILNAGVYISLKKLRHQHDTETIVLVTYAISALIMLIPVLLHPPVITTLPIKGLILMCSIGFVGQLCMTLGFKFATAGVSSMFMLSIIPLTTLSGILLFNEIYTTVFWMGMGLVIASLIVIARWQ
jgi:drug/metabolite transporter (DMT)-like permease